MNLISNHKTRAIDGLLAIGTDTAIDAAHRVAALTGVLYYFPASLLEEDRFEITTAGEEALAEADRAAASATPAAEPAAEPAEAEEPKRRRRTKAEMEAARAEEAAKAAAAAAEPAEPAQTGRGISDTPEDRQEPAGAVEESGDPTDAEPAEEDWDADSKADEPAETVTKSDLIALLNRYAAKHPKKAAGAKEVIATYAGTEKLGEVDPSDYGAIATAMRTYLDAA